MPLTELQAKNAKPADKNYMLRDDKCLYLYVTQSGKYWIMRTWANGREKKTSLGPYPEISLKDARAKRDEINSARARGEDPFTETVTKKDTFGDVTADWLSVRMADKAANYLKVINLRLNNYILPELGKLQISAITSGDILRLCRSIEARGIIETASRVKVIIGQIFRYAIAAGIVNTDPTIALQGALKSRSAKHYATVTEPAKVALLMRNIQAYPYTVVRTALLLSALTFCRPGEIRMAEWSEFDPDACEWRIPAEKMKMKRVHIVPLATQVLKFLEELREFTGGCRWLFPSSRSDGRPMSDNTVRIALRSMGYGNEDMTAHGFRAMASTILNENGFPPDVIERQLAHAERNAIRAAYNHAEYLPERRKLMQWYADFLLI